MAASEPRPQRGTVTRWEDGRGYGFVTPDGGGPAVFLHIKAFGSTARRPVPGERLSFFVMTGSQGAYAAKARFEDETARGAVPVTASPLPRSALPRRDATAANRSVARPAPRIRPVRSPHRQEPRHALSTGFVLGLSLLGYAAATWFWRVPAWVGLVYLGMSLVALLVYAGDKSAARAGRWRTSEQTLLLIGLTGGWPGALVAQRMLRHKTRKAAFQVPFWLSVLANLAGFIWFFSPFGRSH